MISFKFKLVLYFLVLSLLPMLAAFAGFSAVANLSESRLADARLQSGLRAGIAAYEEQLTAAEKRAAKLAANAGFQRALRAGDRERLHRILRESPSIRVESTDGFTVGRRFPRAAERKVVVIGPPRGQLGVVVASVPLDASLVRAVHARSGLEPDERVVFVDHDRIVASERGVAGWLRLPSGRTVTVSLGGERYRALAAAPTTAPQARLAVLTPQSRVDAANRTTSRRLLAALAIAMVLVLLVAYLEGRTIVRTVRTLVDAARGIASGRLDERVPVRGRDEFALLGRAFNEMAVQLGARLEDLDNERQRLRDATVRFGEALAATHDVDQLLPTIVETAVDAAGATGGVLVGPKGEIHVAGEPDSGAQRFELPLVAGGQSFGTLTLLGEDFSIQDVETVSILLGHAMVALDNARLHAIVERQALVDGLTGLANRRHAEEALHAEVARATRFGGPLSVVLADLDDFKSVNDRFGHPTCDAVLRERADVLRENVREVDLPARWGGEEFMLLLPGTDLAGAAQVAERMRAALGRRAIATLEHEPLTVTASFGVASYGGPRSADGLLAAADDALYRAKRRGKNAVVAESAATAA